MINWLVKIILLLSMCIPLGARATTIIDFSLLNQIELSHDCVRVQLTSKDLSQPDIAKYRFHIVESIYGAMSGDFEIELASNLIGIPQFEENSEYVLFLNLNNHYEKVIGHRWGAFGIEGANELIVDGNGRVINLNQKPGADQDFHYVRQQRGQALSELRYQEFRSSVRLVHKEFILHGGKQPRRPAN
jgi:hypothetical protein